MLPAGRWKATWPFSAGSINLVAAEPWANMAMTLARELFRIFAEALSQYRPGSRIVLPFWKFSGRTIFTIPELIKLFVESDNIFLLSISIHRLSCRKLQETFSWGREE